MPRIVARTVLREVLRTLRHPRRLAKVFRVREVIRHLQRESIRDYVRESWREDRSGRRLRRRAYACYEDYLTHQRDKVERISARKMEKYDREFRTALRERLERRGGLPVGTSVLCLAARRGTEVKAFHDLGCFAVGIDLNPGPDNRYVLPGDFHDVPFPAACVDAVFTNSLDHAYDLNRLLGEIRRVLKPGGLLILEAANGSDEGLAPGFYESCWWSRTEDLIALLADLGFELLDREPFDRPWPGEHFRFAFTGASRPAGAASAEPEEALA
ncbi:MAG: hypothetical protein AMXMBFR83_09920 [Phycisphaerae bacterium]